MTFTNEEHQSDFDGSSRFMSFRDQGYNVAKEAEKNSTKERLEYCMEYARHEHDDIADAINMGLDTDERWQGISYYRGCALAFKELLKTARH